MDDGNIKNIFLVGDNFENILFEASINYAKAGFHVWYISFFPFEKVPPNIIIPEKEVLNLITFVYLKDYRSLISHLNGIHLWRKPPRIILVSGFEEYCSINEHNYDPLCGALVATSLLDACSTVAKILNSVTYLITTCRILNSFESRLNNLKNLYFPNMFNHSEDLQTLKKIFEAELK